LEDLVIQGIFVWTTICHFVIKKKSQTTLSKEFLRKFSKKSSHLKEKRFEIVKIFEQYVK
jgi:hypothetical protein